MNKLPYNLLRRKEGCSIMHLIRKHLTVFVFVIVSAVLLHNPIDSFADINEDLKAAAFEGQTEKVKTLLTRGALVNAKDTNGETALMAAKDNTKIVGILLAHGADVKSIKHVSFTGSTNTDEIFLAKGVICKKI